ncbi:MAG TPA: hypothetical protein VFL34_12965 [Candidatus Sulfotelmatobacter sp.]|nr:hypothetical protein [Candidatus Sulfotelmatobacter sp.]
MNTAIIFTWSASPGANLTLWWWTDDWGTFHTFQAAPSYNQGYNQGVASLVQVRAYMPVVDPNQSQTPTLAYIMSVLNLSGQAGQPASSGHSMIDVYAAWQ